MLAQYDAAVAAATIRPDAGQRRAAQALNALLEKLSASPAPKRRLLGLLPPAPTKTLGFYLWGDVGRGKSMLMDMFVEASKKTCATRRVHFHAFMLDVHKRMFAYRQVSGGDVIGQVIRELAGETRVLCLDEFQVLDVADAMILARLFSGLMDAGVVTVFTSNRPPRQLYQGGLQRDQFLKFVAVLEARIPMVELNGAQDYRLAQLKSMARSFVYPRDGEADDFLLDSWKMLTANAQSEPLRVDNEGRILRVDKHAHGIAWFTFGELCVRPLGASDYLMIARLFHTVLLQGIPKLAAEDRNEAKRFVTLIDALYDHRVKLVATAATAPEEIYNHGDGTFEFHRTVSRLHEMQSEAYLGLAHIG